MIVERKQLRPTISELIAKLTFNGHQHGLKQTAE
jgi:hypothetical protein